mmetsp:Transcript_52654/g.109879  ORF Transcript_52654/g.109879 Transcript_52654/m.109879 type:complete len:129 (+) Transcript_52654:380-766(+)
MTSTSQRLFQVHHVSSPPWLAYPALFGDERLFKFGIPNIIQTIYVFSKGCLYHRHGSSACLDSMVPKEPENACVILGIFPFWLTASLLYFWHTYYYSAVSALPLESNLSAGGTLPRVGFSVLVFRYAN